MDCVIHLDTARQTRRTVGAALAVVAILLSAFPGHAAQNYHVSPAGNDANPGTPSQPFRQIRRALVPLQAGDTVLVEDGSYLGFDAFDKIGTAGAPITLRATGTNAIVTRTTDRSDNRDTIRLEDCEYFVVDGFRSFGGNRASLRVQGGHHVTIRNCVFGNNTTWGLFTGFSDDLLIENNECFGSTNEHGIYVSNSGDRPVLRGNRCFNNGGAGIQLNADVNIQPGDGIITGALLENNVIYNNGTRGGGAFNFDGVQDSLVRNNLLFNNHASGMIFFQIDGAEGPRGNRVYHNTIDMPADGRWALNFLQTTGTNWVRNNILLTRHSFRGGLRMGDATDVANTDSDYNVLTRITPDDNAVLTLAQWQAQGREPHSISATHAAVLVDDAAANYHLKPGSPAVDSGQVLSGIPIDLEGMNRPFGAGPDLGCYELTEFRMFFQPISSGRYLLKLQGGHGRSYQLDRSSTLTNWTPDRSFVRSNRPMEQVVTNFVEAVRAFRASFQP